MVIHEETLSAHYAIIAADIIGPPVLACERTLHAAVTLRDEELMGCQVLFLLTLVLFCILLLPACIVFHRIEPILAIGILFVLAIFLDDIVALHFAFCQYRDVGDFVPNRLNAVNLC